MPLQRLLLAVGICILAAGCDIPTEPPIVQQRWILPFEAVTLDQSELLPSSVSIVGSIYDVALPDASASETLGNLCPSCAAVDGLLVPVPAFQGSFTSVDGLPNDVLEAEVSSGSVTLAITNGLSFDPIADSGSVTITIRGAGGGPTLGSLVLDGSVDSLPAGSVTNRTLLLSSGTVVSALETSFSIDSKGGTVSTIDVDDMIDVSVSNGSLQVGSVIIDIAGNSATLTEQPFDVEDLDEDIVDLIESGAVVMNVTNPFGVTFVGTITLGSVTKDVSIPLDTASTVTVAYTGDELRTILGGSDVMFSGFGALGGGPATIQAGDELMIDPTIDLIIELGS